MHIARALATVAATLSSGIIFPLYIYPNEDCSAWTPIINAISSHPSLPFIVIVNPNSGPGGAPQPDSSYQACIPLLRAANTLLLGYVHTSYGARPAVDVNNDIALYAGWGAEIRLDGVFFDEASAEGDATHISQLQGYASTARSEFANFVVLNPGTPPASQYFTFSDMIVTAENSYSSFSVSILPTGPLEPASKQAVILHHAPTSDAPYTSLLTQLLDVSAGGLGIGAIFISEAEYTSVSVNWNAFVVAVQTAAS